MSAWADVGSNPRDRLLCLGRLAKRRSPKLRRRVLLGPQRIVAMPSRMTSLRRKRLAEKTIQPSPLLAVISSAATTLEKAPAIAIRSPVKIIGSDEGKITIMKI